MFSFTCFVVICYNKKKKRLVIDMKGKYAKIINYLLYPKGYAIAINVFIIALLSFFVYLFVYCTGGTKYVYTHSSYLPVIFASVVFGVKGGFITGIICGVLLGPLMPLDTKTGEVQETLNWVFRMGVFVIVGVFSGLMANVFRYNTKRIIDYLTHNQETGIPNISALTKNYLIKETLDDENTQLAFSILINKYENIIEVISRDHYNDLINQIYHNLRSNLPQETQIIQSATDKIWVAIKDPNIEEYINKILTTLNVSYYINNIPLFVTFSIGVCRHQNYYSLIDTFKNADMSARRAQKYNVPYLIFQNEHIESFRNIELLGMFRNALYQEELNLHYQPKICLKTNKPIGIEALLRWNHPKHGEIKPLEIIPLIEETELINTLTYWVLKRSLDTVSNLSKLDIKMKISLNISPKNLMDKNFIDRLIDLVDHYNIDNECIEFEITESALIENLDLCAKLLKHIKDYRIGLSIDDFGIGYSSLSYLSNLPVDIVKIDRFFINQMTKEKAVRHIVHSTIELVHDLGMKVVAEGVENQEQLEILKGMNCDYVQGYLYAKPMNETDLINWYLEYHKEERI